MARETRKIHKQPVNLKSDVPPPGSRKSIYFESNGEETSRSLKTVIADKSRETAGGPRFPWMMKGTETGVQKTLKTKKTVKSDDSGPTPGPEYDTW